MNIVDLITLIGFIISVFKFGYDFGKKDAKK